jgi:hypothetical protein
MNILPAKAWFSKRFDLRISKVSALCTTYFKPASNTYCKKYQYYSNAKA